MFSFGWDELIASALCLLLAGLTVWLVRDADDAAAGEAETGPSYEDSQRMLRAYHEERGEI